MSWDADCVDAFIEEYAQDFDLFLKESGSKDSWERKIAYCMANLTLFTDFEANYKEDCLEVAGEKSWEERSGR